MKMETLATNKKEYEQVRNTKKVAEWIVGSFEEALSPESACRDSKFESFDAEGKFPGDSAYHAYYPLACELFPQGPMEHFDWWVDGMRKATEKLDHKPAIWIPATATPVMLEIAMQACGHEADYIVSDLCQTPLNVIKSAYGDAVHTYHSNIFQPNIDLWRWMGGAFDIIATDAFITRFAPAQVKDIFKTFETSLRHGGKVFTTIRQPKDKETASQLEIEDELAIQTYPDRAMDAWDKYSARNSMQLNNRIDRDLVRKLATIYANSMKSRHGQNLEIEEMLEDARLQLSVFHDISLPRERGLAQNAVSVFQTGLRVNDVKISQFCEDITSRQYQLWELERPLE